jgi:hypothetical protein
MGIITVFAEEPPIGTRIMLDDQAYELVGSEPYTRKTDGAASRLLTWETTCPVEGCLASFRAQSGLSITWLRRRCDQHANALTLVQGRRGRRVRVRVELA